VRAAEVVRKLGGTATTGQILELTTARALRTAHAHGELIRVQRGVYRLPVATRGPWARAVLHGVLSHQSAASYWQLEQLNPADEIHVMVPRRHHRRPPPGVRVHYGDVAEKDATSPLRTVLDCARALSFADALAIADSACRRRLVTREELITAAEAIRGAGRTRIRRVAAHADGRADNPFESGLRAIVVEAGITGFEPQLVVPGLNPVVRVDLGDRRRRIVLEADSFAHHGSRGSLRRDCRRYDELISRDWLVLRFAWEHVMSDRRWLRQRVLATCALRDTTVQLGRSAGIQPQKRR
jgi:very-short-patch-repair endonuclease